MARQAILLPYCVDQNEPSTPLKFIFNVPDDVVERDKLLRALFIEHVCDDVEEADIHISEPDEGYGDVVVSWDDDMFLFLTYIE